MKIKNEKTSSFPPFLYNKQHKKGKKTEIKCSIVQVKHFDLLPCSSDYKLEE